MSLFYKKNEFEKKSSRERYRIERAELYFRKKAGSTPLIYFAGAAILGLYAYWGGGPLHYIAAALFAGLGVWQFFYVNRAAVSAPEVDERAGALRETLDLQTDSLNASDMDYDDFIKAPKIEIWGYAPLPAGKEEAILRADREDDDARSSHVQFTVFTFGPESLEAYSVVLSLLGKEKDETLMEWPYSQLKGAGFERVARDCSLEPGGAKTEIRKFPAVTIRSGNKRMTRSYALCEACRSDAEELVRRIQEQIDLPEKGN